MAEPDKAENREVPGYAEFAGVPGKRFSLRIKEFAKRPDPATETFRPVLAMDRPADAVLLPGMTATVTATMTRRDMRGARVIPAGLLFADDQGSAHVWVVDRETMRVGRRAVTTGELTGQAYIQVIGGLEPGEMIAASGVSQLRAGHAGEGFRREYIRLLKNTHLSRYSGIALIPDTSGSLPAGRDRVAYGRGAKFFALGQAQGPAPAKSTRLFCVFARLVAVYFLTACTRRLF